MAAQSVSVPMVVGLDLVTNPLVASPNKLYVVACVYPCSPMGTVEATLEAQHTANIWPENVLAQRTDPCSDAAVGREAKHHRLPHLDVTVC